MVDYISVAEARNMPGLRIVLTPMVPGPWSESAKGVFGVKNLDYAPVLQEVGGENQDLLDWTAQATAPVVAWNDELPRSTWIEQLYLAEKYHYDSSQAEEANRLVIEILDDLSEQLSRQKAKGSKFLIGDSLSALDIYWSACAATFDPLPNDKCPMPDMFRAIYADITPEMATAATPELLAHRDFIYNNYLTLPIDL